MQQHAVRHLPQSGQVELQPAMGPHDDHVGLTFLSHCQDRRRHATRVFRLDDAGRWALGLTGGSSQLKLRAVDPARRVQLRLFQDMQQDDTSSSRPRQVQGVREGPEATGREINGDHQAAEHGLGPAAHDQPMTGGRPWRGREVELAYQKPK